MTDYLTVDVFADAPFLGNPLAVVPDARLLDPADFQQLAREFAYSETTFLLPPDDPANTARMRIFTPAEEMPFAGHPNVGTAYVAGRLGALFGQPVGDRMRFEEPAGVVDVALVRDGGMVVGADVRAPHDLAFGAERDAAIIAGLAAIDPDAVSTMTHPPVYASVGAGFLFAEVSLAALSAARPVNAAFQAEADRPAGAAVAALPALFLWARQPLRRDDGLALEARMFAPLSGIPEDPATGSAAAALGALLASLGIADRLSIRQGTQMGRPSIMTVRHGVDGTWISGRCAPMFRGTIGGRRPGW